MLLFPIGNLDNFTPYPIQSNPIQSNLIQSNTLFKRYPASFVVTSPVMLVGRTFQASSSHSDCGNWPGAEAALFHVINL